MAFRIVRFCKYDFRRFPLCFWCCCGFRADMQSAAWKEFGCPASSLAQHNWSLRTKQHRHAAFWSAIFGQGSCQPDKQECQKTIKTRVLKFWKSELLKVTSNGRGAIFWQSHRSPVPLSNFRRLPGQSKTLENAMFFGVRRLSQFFNTRQHTTKTTKSRFLPRVNHWKMLCFFVSEDYLLAAFPQNSE